MLTVFDPVRRARGPSGTVDFVEPTRHRRSRRRCRVRAIPLWVERDDLHRVLCPGHKVRNSVARLGRLGRLIGFTTSRGYLVVIDASVIARCGPVQPEIVWIPRDGEIGWLARRLGVGRAGRNRQLATFRGLSPICVDCRHSEIVRRICGEVGQRGRGIGQFRLFGSVHVHVVVIN